MSSVSVAAAERVGRLIDASPTPYHAVEQAVIILQTAGGRVPVNSRQAATPGLWYLADGGTLAAWLVAEHHGASSGLRIVGAHTDSPNLRLKPRPEHECGGYRMLRTEVYGAALLNSWLDRDLGVAGRIAVRDEAQGARTQLVHIDRPLLRIPQLAIHLDRDVNKKGLVLNQQQHLSAVYALEAETHDGSTDFLNIVANAAEVEPRDLLYHELMAFDLNEARLVGNAGSMLSSARIDNLVSCFAAVTALVDVASRGPGPHVAATCLFDHEEVGSVSATGAASPWLQNLIARLGAGFDASFDDLATARADSLMLSADGAHATHPSYPERHDPEHPVVLNGGPVLKTNTNQRYATNAVSGAAFRLACEQAEVPMQHFVNRSDVACGSTIGPVTAGRTGIATVDAGCAQLAMHSIRELCGAHDIAWFQAAVKQFLLG